MFIALIVVIVSNIYIHKFHRYIHKFLQNDKMYIYILPVCKNLLISWLNYMQFIVCQLFISKVFFKEKPKILALNI